MVIGCHVHEETRSRDSVYNPTTHFDSAAASPHSTTTLTNPPPAHCTARRARPFRRRQRQTHTIYTPLKTDYSIYSGIYYTMLASTSDYISVRPNTRTRDSSMSPSCRFQRLYTPPRQSSTTTKTAGQRYESPMLTPSPLRRRALFPYDDSTATDADEDEDIFLQSPFRSPHRYHSHPAKPLPILTDDDDGGIFLSAPQQNPLSPFTPFPSSQSLRTPIKQVHRTPSNSYLSIHAQPQTATSAFGPGGTKRKESGGGGADYSTPLRQHVMTPLGISSVHSQTNTLGSNGAGDDGSMGTGVSFDRLAPLPAPRFTTPQHPQSKAEMEVHLKRHTETMTKLRICDLDDSDSDSDVVGGGGMCGGRGLGLFSAAPSSVFGRSAGRTANTDNTKSHTKGTAVNAKPKSKSASLGRSLGASLLAIAQTRQGKGKGAGKDDEVAEAISPGGHITKRRARSRPVSQELLESVAARTPSPAQVRVRALYSSNYTPSDYPIFCLLGGHTTQTQNRPH